jgi:hypothetical protein
MKINGENYETMARHVAGFAENHSNAAATAEEYKARDLSFRRYCFDLFYASKFRVGDGIGLDGHITVPDCTDENIATALRKIVKDELNVKAW